MFLPYSIQVWTSAQILVRTYIAPESIVRIIQNHIATVNPDQQTGGEIRDLEAWIREEPVWARGRLISALFGGFSVLAVALSAVGLYSIVSYTVARRINEFGIRIALGGSRGHVWRTAIYSITVTVGIGVVLGVILAIVLNRLATNWIGSYISSITMLTTGILILVVVSGIACGLPALRASRTDPAIALRCD